MGGRLQERAREIDADAGQSYGDIMKLSAVLGLLVLVSCGPSVTLYTDAVFRGAAPEVVGAWSSLAPAHPVRTAELPRDAAKALRERLEKDGTSLIGAVLGPGERAALAAEFPRARLVFFVPSEDAGGQADIAVDREQAWAVVAEAAAQTHTAATALFPSNATAEELERFTQVWRKAGGGTLTAVVWPVTQISGSDPLFQWAGTAAEPFVRALPSGRVVHTDPGLDKAPGGTGLTWRIRREGLAELLWKAASETAKTTYFLPVEAVNNSHP